MSAVQRCPVCLGTGVVSRPPGIAADQESWTWNSAGPFTCSVCKGQKVLWQAATEQIRLQERLASADPEISRYLTNRYLDEDEQGMP